jgi:hypothetical protein
VVQGTIRTDEAGRDGVVFAGLFPDRMPQGRPVRRTILERPGPYRFERVPQGSWYLPAHSVLADRLNPRDVFAGDDGLSVGINGPTTVRWDASAVVAAQTADLVLRPVRAVDPPVLLALLDTRTAALAVAGGRLDAVRHAR